MIYIDPPFNSNRNYEVFWGETKERRAFEDRHASTAAYIGTGRFAGATGSGDTTIFPAGGGVGTFTVSGTLSR